MYPARWFYRSHEEEPTTEVALRRSVADDLYLVLHGYVPATQTATIQIMINPLVNWIWFGVGVILIGTGIALIPERAFRFAMAAVPEGAVTSSVVLFALLAGAGTTLRAQHVETGQTVIVAPRSAEERDLQGAIICMCGTCGRKRIGECTCEVAAQMREEVASLVAAGKSREQVVQYFIGKYGSQEVLAEPIDKGFNRLAWTVPYAVGGVSLLTIVGIAVRWSRRRTHATSGDAAPASFSPELQDRLDDELRDLD